MWAQQFEHVHDGNSQTKEHSHKAVKTTLTGTTATDLTDVFDNGKVTIVTTATTARGCNSCPDALSRTPGRAAVSTRLQTTEDFLNYRLPFLYQL